MDLGIGLAGISNRSNSAVRIWVQDSEGHVVLNPVLNSVAAPDTSSLGRNVVVSIMAKAPAIWRGRCISRSMVA